MGSYTMGFDSSESMAPEMEAIVGLHNVSNILEIAGGSHLLCKKN